jgi:hypothetical protein
MKYTMHFLTALLLIGASGLNGQDSDDPEICRAACIEVLVAAAERGMESAHRRGTDPTVKYLEVNFGTDPEHDASPDIQRIHRSIEERLGLSPGAQEDHPAYRACIADPESVACAEGGGTAFIRLSGLEMTSTREGTVYVLVRVIRDSASRPFAAWWNSMHYQRYRVELIDDKWVTTPIGSTFVSE